MINAAIVLGACWLATFADFNRTTFFCSFGATWAIFVLKLFDWISP